MELLYVILALLPYALAFSASSFLYIALADFIPEMHRKTSIRSTLTQFSLILVGILIIYLVLQSK